MSPVLLWFDENPARYWWFVCFAAAVVLYMAARPLLHRIPPEPAGKSDWGWGWAIAAMMLAGRWPYLVVSTELNADESQMLAGALTLRHDPVFWRSVDANTAGPLNVYLLIPFQWMLGSESYLPARAAAVLLLGAMLWFLHAGIARLAGRLNARLATLPALLFEALTTHPDYTHCSTELLSLTLLTAAFLLGAGEWRAAVPRTGVRAGFGLLLGSVPFAKLQGIPLAAVMAGLLVMTDVQKPGFRLRGHSHAWLAMAGGGILPTMLVTAAVLATGVTHDAFTSYILGNFSYTTSSGFSLAANLGYMWASISHRGDLVLWWLGGVAVLTLGAVAAGRHPFVWRTGFLPAGMLLAAGMFTVLAPNRPFAHYLQYLLPPVTLLTAACIAQLLAARSVRPAFVTALLLVPTVSVLAGRSRSPHPYVGVLAAHHTRAPSMAVQWIKRLSTPDEAIAVWGWMSSYHVESGRRQALRESHSSYQIRPVPMQSYYRRRYLEDFARSRPAVFVDATGPGNFHFKDRAAAHDAVFPELGARVLVHYLPVIEINGARIYLRRDLAARSGFDPLCDGTYKP